MNGFVLFFIAHLLIGLIAKEVFGLNISANPNGLVLWDNYWQTLKAVDLQQHLLTSIWTLHSQPPLLNLYGGIMMQIFGDSALSAMHYANIVLGAFISGLSYRVLHFTTRTVWIAVLGALLITLNPALLLFEAYPLYTVPSLFFIMLGVFYFAQYQQRHQARDLFAFILVVNLLVLTRSLYHPLILLPCIGLAVWLARGQRWRVLRTALLISLLGFGWATKNAVQYGFWGTSSWGGLNLWHIAADGYSAGRLHDFSLVKVIDPLVVEFGSFTYPSSYQGYGFDKTSDVESLNRNDYNNINMPDIARVYQRSGIALIQYDPVHYLTNVARAYNTFTCPATSFKHNALNAPKIGGLVDFYENTLYGVSAWQARGIELLGTSGGCSVLYAGLPLSLLAFGLLGLVVAGLSWRRWRQFFRQEPVLLLIVAIIFYTTVVGSSLDIGENDRFKFLIEPLWWILLLVLGQRFVLRVQGRYPDWTVPRPAAPVAPKAVLPAPAPVVLPTPDPEPAPTVMEATPEASPPPRRAAWLGLLLSALALGGVAVWWRQRKTAGR